MDVLCFMKFQIVFSTANFVYKFEKSETFKNAIMYILFVQWSQTPDTVLSRKWQCHPNFILFHNTIDLSIHFKTWDLVSNANFDTP